MDFRLAVIQDLPQFKRVYKDIIRNMNHNQIQIWDDIYPCEFFDEVIGHDFILQEYGLLTSQRGGLDRTIWR